MAESDIDFAYWFVAPGGVRTNAPGTCLWCGKKLRQKYNTTYEYYTRIPLKSPCCKADVIEERGSCWCDECDKTINTSRRRVVSRVKSYERPGDYGDGAFCTLRCGYMFGVAAAKNGFRLMRLTEDA